MLTHEGFNLVITSFILLLFTTTVIVYPPLTLSLFAVTAFTLSYVLMAAKNLKTLKPTDFVFSRKIFPNQPRPGEVLEVQVSVTNRSSKALHLTVVDSFEGLQLVQGSSTVERFLKPNDVAMLKYSLRPPGRGVYTLGPLVVKVADDYGICCKYITLEKEAKVLVRPVPSEKHKLVEGVRWVHAVSVSGTGSSVKYGADDVFREITKHEEGQPLKSIDWRRTARDDGEIYIRKYDRLNRLKVLFLLDCTVSNMVGKPPALDTVISAVASTSRAMLEKGDIVTVKALGALEPGSYTATGTRDFEGLANFLTVLKPGVNFDFLKEVERAKGFDAVFLLGRLAFVSGQQLKHAGEEVRRYGGVFYVVIPVLEAEGEMERVLAELEMSRIETMKRHAGFVTALKQHEIPHYLSHLHRMLRAVS
ncbi:MAG: DUF58 domain-containing protein [Candidatus Caldarchaeum sp.]